MRKLVISLKGGPGSGNYGHAGRPGLVGGSTPSGVLSPLSEDLQDKISSISVSVDAGLEDYDSGYSTFREGDTGSKSAYLYGTKLYLDGQFNKSEVAAMDAWTHEKRMCTAMSTLLREQDQTGIDHLHDARIASENLTDVLARCVIPDNIIVYRGVSDEAFIQFLSGMNKGDVLTDKAFMSTTLVRRVATEFSGDGNTLFEIRLPKGTHGMYMGHSLYDTEREVLLQRSTGLRIDKIRHEAGNMIIECTAIQSDTLPPIPEVL